MTLLASWHLLHAHAHCLRHGSWTGLSFEVALHEVVVAIEFDQSLEHPDLMAAVCAPVGVGEATAAGVFANHGNAGDDVDALADRSLDRFDMMVQGQQRVIGLLNQRVAVVAVGFRERTVDRDRLAAAFER